MHRFLLIPLLLLLSGCCYKFGTGSITEKYSSIYVPYVVDDKDGSLTAEVIKKVCSSTGLEYTCDCPDLILYIKIIEFRDENIGFRYDRNKDESLTRTIIPVETRLATTVEVWLVDTASGITVQGPARISTRIDFDHEYYSVREEINIFSLGQLTDSDEATDAAYHPLSVELAKKIVDYINNCW